MVNTSESWCLNMNSSSWPVSDWIIAWVSRCTASVYERTHAYKFLVHWHSEDDLNCALFSFRSWYRWNSTAYHHWESPRIPIPHKEKKKHVYSLSRHERKGNNALIYIFTYCWSTEVSHLHVGKKNPIPFSSSSFISAIIIDSSSVFLFFYQDQTAAL